MVWADGGAVAAETEQEQSCLDSADGVGGGSMLQKEIFTMPSKQGSCESSSGRCCLSASYSRLEYEVAECVAKMHGLSCWALFRLSSWKAGQSSRFGLRRVYQEFKTILSGSSGTGHPPVRTRMRCDNKLVTMHGPASALNNKASPWYLLTSSILRCLRLLC
jgi:hypothetical protein